MKKFILVTFVALALLSCGSKEQYTLNGEIIPAKEGKVVLFGFEKGNPVAVDTAEIVDGKFTFKGETSLPDLRLIGFPNQRGFIANFFVEAGNINLSIFPDSTQSNIVEGSKSQDIFKVFLDEMVKFSKSENDLKQRFQSAQMSGNEEEIDAVRFEYETMVDNTKLFSRNFISEYSESPVAAYVYLMNFFQEAEVEELDSMLQVFEPIKESEFVSVIQERADALRKSAIGAVAPDFTLNDAEGNPVTLSSFNGKYVLIDFWASWCQPCMMELPNVAEQYTTYKDKDFVVVGVSLDRDKKAWLATLDARNMDWPNVWDMEGKVATDYGLTSIPHTVLLDKEGKIMEKNLRGEELKAKLAELLN